MVQQVVATYSGAKVGGSAVEFIYEEVPSEDIYLISQVLKDVARLSKNPSGLGLVKKCVTHGARDAK